VAHIAPRLLTCLLLPWHTAWTALTSSSGSSGRASLPLMQPRLIVWLLLQLAQLVVNPRCQQQLQAGVWDL
jgi:hypothetical protein